MENIQNIDGFLNKYHLSRLLIKSADITVETNENTYLPPEEMRTGWLHLLYSTFSKGDLEVHGVESLALVGVGAGVESFLFIEKFRPKNLYALDINPGVLAAAERNIRKNLKKDVTLSVKVECSDVLEYLKVNKVKVDLIYENLPNLKLSNELPIENGLTSSSFFSEKVDIEIPKAYDLNMLRLHYRFLSEAKECLNPQGKVICCIGARIPIETVKTMFTDLGYEFNIIRIGLVQQLAAMEVVETYKEIESRTGARFLFLTHNSKKAKEIINNYKDGDDLSEFYDSFGKLRLSANRAFVRLSLDREIDHIGMIIEGKLK